MRIQGNVHANFKEKKINISIFQVRQNGKRICSNTPPVFTMADRSDGRLFLCWSQKEISSNSTSKPVSVYKTFFKSILNANQSFVLLDIQLVRVAVIIGGNGDSDLCQLSVATIRYEIRSAGIWIIRRIEPCWLGHRFMLHHVRVLSRLRGTSQLVSQSSIVATNFQTLLFHLSTAFPNNHGHNGHIKNITLLHRIDCCKLYFA